MTRLELWRIRRKLSIKELAAKSGVNRATINRIEHNRSRPYGQTLGKLAEALNLDPSELLEEGSQSLHLGDHSEKLKISQEELNSVLKAFEKAEKEEGPVYELEEVEHYLAELVATYKEKATF